MTTNDDTITRIMQARDLDALLDALTAATDEGIDLGNVVPKAPTFGGTFPPDTRYGAISWDAERVLWMDGSGGYVIEDRKEEEEA